MVSGTLNHRFARRGLSDITIWALACSGVMILMILMAALVPSGIWSGIAVLAFLAFLIGAGRKSPYATILAAPLLIALIIELISGVAIESGGFMTESGVQGHPSGAFARLSLIYLWALVVGHQVMHRSLKKYARMLVRAYKSDLSRIQRISSIIVLAASAFLVLYLVAVGLQKGFPLITGDDRFSFRRAAEDHLLVSLIDNRPIFGYTLGLVLLKPPFRKWAIAVFFSMIAVSVLYGEKFGSIVELMVIIASPTMLAHIALRGRVPRKLVALVAVIIVSITVPATLTVYGGAKDGSHAFTRLIDRIVLQGQMWYLADTHAHSLFAWDGRTIEADMQSWVGATPQLREEVGMSFGLYYAMAELAPIQSVLDFISTNNSYTMVLLPYAMLVAGFPGVILAALVTASLYGITLRELMYAIATRNWILIAIGVKTIIWLVAGIVSGYAWFIVGYKTLIFISLLILIRLIQERVLKRRTLARIELQRRPVLAPLNGSMAHGGAL